MSDPVYDDQLSGGIWRSLVQEGRLLKNELTPERLLPHGDMASRRPPINLGVASLGVLGLLKPQFWNSQVLQD